MNGKTHFLRAGDVLRIPAGCKHMVHAETDLNIIEVQLGETISVEDKSKYALDASDTVEENERE